MFPSIEVLADLWVDVGKGRKPCGEDYFSDMHLNSADYTTTLP